MTKKTIILITLLIGTFIFVPLAHGASFFVSSMPAVKVGDDLEIVVNLDTEGESVNSILATVDYNENLLEFRGYKDVDSLIKLWIETPHEKNGTVTFSGIIPGGVDGVYDAQNKNKLAPIPIVKLLFEAKEAGTVEFTFGEYKVLKNDGLGSVLRTTSETNTLQILENSTFSLSNNKSSDKNPPLSFSISFVQASLFSKTPSMIIFSTNDLESGVKEYQVKDGWGAWKVVESPLPVKLGIWSRTVRIRAYDFEGNLAESSIEIPGSPLALWLTICILFAVASIWVRKLIK